MGKYLSIFNAIKENIYNDNINEASRRLKELLNHINFEYTALNPGEEKNKRKGAIVKLLPVLKELNKGNINDIVINALKLDVTKLKPVVAPTPIIKEQPKEEIKKEEKPIINTKKKEIDIDDNSIPLDQIIDDDDIIPVVKEEVKKEPMKKAKRVINDFIPLYLDDYIGQEKAKQSLRISIEAAKKENRVLNHLLICSSYGLGKTTLANIIANEMGLPFFNVNATNLKDAKSVSTYFSKIKENCIIFIDEIHCLKNDVQSILLSILTDFQVNFINDEGEEEKYDLPAFTLIGATTQAGELLKPFINRFQILELVDYTDEEKEVIVKSKFDKIGYEISQEGIKEIAKRSRGVPRTIEIFTRGIRDIALTKNTKVVDEDIINTYFDMYDIDENGLNKNDLYLLKILSEAERPLALITLESKSGIQREDIEYRYEPFLIKLGLIEKTEKGRIITNKGREYIGSDVSQD